MALGLYIHIPFCVRKCRYCDFLSFASDESLRRKYLDALLREIRFSGEICRGRGVDTVFIGGGTPSVLPAAMIREILDAVGASFPVIPGAEVTMEMNPGASWSEEDMKAALGGEDGSGEGIFVNRVSIGAQSFHDDELRALGRIHDADTFFKTYDMVRRCGISNVNIDLMYGIPGQSPARFRETLRAAAALSPEHISPYSLIIEEGTPFYEAFRSGTLVLPGEEEEAEMAADAVRILGDAGYRHYEISNFAKEGFVSRHNCRYWKREDYLGIGLGAASLMGHTRWSNVREMDRYLAVFGETGNPGLPGSGAGEKRSGYFYRENIETLTAEEEMEEFFFLGLRMTDGVRKEDFRTCFGRSVYEEYGDVIRKYAQTGLLCDEGDRIFLTEEGLRVSNVILSDFLHDQDE